MFFITEKGSNIGVYIKSLVSCNPMIFNADPLNVPNSLTGMSQTQIYSTVTAEMHQLQTLLDDDIFQLMV